ncbi:hypothetical protein [Streptomyces sp. MBT62]|uniref:hypothetical protein n=1 Tax=Streptomyces sp. MBT62 TaxID=2800410 RepID=UPI00190D28BA|nr:hypothetical protein [Streptomyces sp. MBT62]MBK3569145.1 hypothetical protein [Streptomyces sp. MBT62]
MMRLSGYHIVSYYFIDEHTDRTYYYPLASGDLPATPSGWVYRTRFQGRENYNSLASDGQTSLTNCEPRRRHGDLTHGPTTAPRAAVDTGARPGIPGRAPSVRSCDAAT